MKQTVTAPTQKRPYLVLVALMLALVWHFAPYRITIETSTDALIEASTRQQATVKQPQPVARSNWPSAIHLNAVQATQSLTITQLAYTRSPFTTANGHALQTARPTLAEPDLSASLKGLPKPLFPGGSLIYQIAITNTGTFTAVGVVMTDTLSDNLSFVSASLPVVRQIGQKYGFVLGNMSPGTTIKMTITAMADSDLAEGHTLVNDVVINAQDLVSSINLSDSTTIAIPTLNKFANPNPVLAGELITYTILYRNDSGGPITNLQITDTPDDVVTSLENVDPGSMTLTQDQLPELIFNQSSVAAGESITLSIVGRVITQPWATSLTPISNTVSAIYNGQSQPDVLTITTYGQPGRPASIELNANSALVSVDDTLIITGTIRDAYGNLVVNNLPVTIQSNFIDSNASAVGYTAYTRQGKVSALVRTPISQTATVTVSVDAVPGLSASLSASFAEPKLTITKVGNPIYVSSNSELVYEVAVESTGTVSAKQIEVIDYLDPNLTVASTSYTGTQNGNTYRFTIPTLAPGHQQTIILTTATASDIPNNTLITNTVTAKTPNSLNAVTATTVSRVANIFLNADVTPDPVRAGGLITYTIQHRNESTQLITTLRVTSTLPSQVEQLININSGSTTVVEDTIPMLIFSRDNVGNNETTTIIITGRVITGPWTAAPTTLSNEVVAQANLMDGRQIDRTGFARNIAGAALPATIQLLAPLAATPNITVPLTVILNDQYGNPALDGTMISITAPPHVTISGEDTTTSGQAMSTVESSQVGPATITVMVNGLTAQITINFSFDVFLPLIQK